MVPDNFLGHLIFLKPNAFNAEPCSLLAGISNICSATQICQINKLSYMVPVVFLRLFVLYFDILDNYINEKSVFDA